MKALHFLAALLVLSLLANIGLAVIIIPAQHTIISRLADRTNTLGMENMQLQEQLDLQNIALQNTVSQLSFYRVQNAGSATTPQQPDSGITGTAYLQAPAVSQRIVQDTTNGPVTRRVVLEGSLMNISVEIRPGQGRVLVETKPLMGIVFQDAANTAVHVAQNKSGISLAGSDVIFSIEAEKQVSAVDGPSAGALMTLVMVSALNNQPIDQNVTLTGTIDKDGHVGMVGGVIEKASVAQKNGKTLFLLPRENSIFVQYTRKTTSYGGFVVVEQVPERVSAQEYIRKNIGIDVIIVDKIDDVLTAGLKQS